MGGLKMEKISIKCSLNGVKCGLADVLGLLIVTNSESFDKYMSELFASLVNLEHEKVCSSHFVINAGKKHELNGVIDIERG